MPVPFGVSVGDFISGLELIHDIIKCLKDSTGAKAQYRGIIAALKSLETALTQARNVSAQLEDERSIEEIVRRSEESIRLFVGKVNKYHHALGHEHVKQWKACLRKIQWQLYSKEDVAGFQHEIRSHVAALSVVMISLSHNTTVQASQHNLQVHAQTANELQQQRRQLNQLSESQSRMSTSLAVLGRTFEQLMYGIAMMSIILCSQLRLLMERLPSRIDLRLAYFTDAHGNPFIIDPNLTLTWRTFHSLLYDNFANRPGLHRVRRGLFRLHDRFARSELDASQPFISAFRPGRYIDMSILFQASEVETEACPRCGNSKAPGNTREHTCSQCGLWYKRFLDYDHTPMVPLDEQSQGAPITKEFRVLDITPGPDSPTTINGVLRIVSLHDEPDYITLSYIRDDSAKASVVEINGKNVQVTDKLYAALRALRSQNQSTMWIGALCINQQDLEEMCEQMNMMETIYETATHMMER
ncbi:Uu.00g117030.m01.CDS01 [Anthostomella pinea]|uniref:Uu.00g117030.m01.CDS01 n=1 Tax=Anthostomella pinea TaxID=933095 RepID=A0AAI8VG42_9PEZI|nr:Uu.00g117030.m01.CDS01 [Anthostomella pinea]